MRVRPLRARLAEEGGDGVEAVERLARRDARERRGREHRPEEVVGLARDGKHVHEVLRVAEVLIERHERAAGVGPGDMAAQHVQEDDPHGPDVAGSAGGRVGYHRVVEAHAL